MLFNQIDRLIETVQFQIKLYLTKNDNNRALIENTFNEISKLAEDLLLNNTEYHGYCMYLYHINYSSFCHSIGEKDDAAKHQNKAKFFQHDYLKSERQISNLKETVETSTTNDLNSCELNNVLKVFAKIEARDFINSEVIQQFKKQLECILKLKVKNFNDYLEIENAAFCIKTLINEIMSKLDDKHESVISDIQKLKEKASKMKYKVQIDFMVKVDASIKPEELLFNNIVLTEENIKTRYRQLAKCFHPDKWKDDENEVLANKIFIIIQQCKESLKVKLKDERLSEDEMNDYEMKGDELWQKSLDLKYAKNQEWNKLKHFKKEDFLYSTKEELENERNKIVDESRQMYRAACITADKRKLSNKHRKVPTKSWVLSFKIFSFEIKVQNINLKLKNSYS